jgi:SAM-dependent methyltransferase
MFFADPAAAFANVRRALVPGGSFAFACWQDVATNEWMMLPGLVVLAVTGELPPMPEPGRPGPFSLADPAHVEGLLAEAAFADVDVVQHAETVVVPEEGLGALVEAALRIGAAREALEASDDPGLRAQLSEAMHEELRGRLSGGEVRLSSAAHVVLAVA